MERLEELIREVRESRQAMEDQIKGMELKKNKEEVAETVAKKVKRSMPPEFRRKGNEKQFKFNEEVVDKIQVADTELKAIAVPADAAAVNVPVAVLEKTRRAIKEGISSIQERQKLIRIVDRSDFGWDVVNEYEADELAADSDDEKKISKAEKAAEQKCQKKKRVSANVKRMAGSSAGMSSQPLKSGEWWRSRMGPPMGSHSQFSTQPWQYSRPTIPNPRPSRIPGPCFASNEFGHVRANCPKTLSPGSSKVSSVLAVVTE